MKKTIRISIVLIILFLYFFVIMRYENYIMIPIFTILLIILLLYDFIFIRIKLKNGKAIRLGKDTSAKCGLIIGIIGGLVFLILGFCINLNGVEYWGISSTSYLGIFFIAMGLLTYENFYILLSDKYLKYKDFLSHHELRYNLDWVIN